MNTLKYKGLRIDIGPDDNADSPDEWGNTDRFIVYDHRSFAIQRDGFNPRDIYRHTNESGKMFYDGYYVFELYAYIHGGVSLSLSHNGDRWDTSMCGFVLVKRKKGTWTRGAAEEAAEGLVKTWNTYLSGDVYYFNLYGPDGELEHSCGGLYGKEWAIEDAKGMADYIIRDKSEKHFNKLKKQIRAKAPVQYRKPFELL